MTDIHEILATMEHDPAAADLLEKAIADAVSEGKEALASLLDELVKSLTAPGPVPEAAISILDRLYRKHRESEVGPVIAWYGALIAWKVLGDLVRAEFFMRGVDGQGPHAQEWREFYRVFYASRGNWLRLEQFLTETADRFGEAKIDTLRLLARTAREFKNPGKELSYWQAVAQEAPEDEEADLELERLYGQMERWPSLANLLKARFDRTPDEEKDVKLALLRRLIEIYRDKMKAEPKVLATYQQILEIDPGNMEAIDTLLASYEATGRWPDYAKVLARKIQYTTDPEEAIRLREQQARLYEQRFANPLEAIKVYEELFALQPHREDILRKLKDLYERRHDFENLLRIQRIEADRETDPVRKAERLQELAVMATDRLHKIPLAIELWEEVLSLVGDHAEALRNLEALYEREKNIEKLCSILERRVELAQTAAERVLLLEKLAQVYSTKAQDTQKATETWRRILEVQPTHERAKRELRARYLADRRYDELEWFMRTFGTVEELARTLEAQVGSIEDPDLKRSILFKLASIWRDELNVPARAVKDLELVLHDDPGNVRAAKDLIVLYKQLSDYKRLPQVYEIAIAGTEDKQERLQMMVEAAEVHEQYLRNLDRAFFWYVEAFKEDMLNENLRAELERLAGPSKNWDAYVAVLEQAANVLPSLKARVATWLRIGQIYWYELKEPSEALRAYREALQLDEENREAIESLELLYREQGDYNSLVSILERKLALERREDLRREIRFEIADVLHRRLGRIDDAISVYRSILEDYPRDARAYAELGEVLLSERRFDELLSLLRKQAEVFEVAEDTPPEVMADLHCRIGLLICGLSGPGMSAVLEWSKALQYVPMHSPTIELLEDLIGVPELRSIIVQLLKGPFEQLGRFSDLADLYEIELLERGEQLDILWTLYELYTGKAKDGRKAFDTLARILEVTPEDRRAWDAIEKVAREVSAFRELAARYEGIAQRLKDQQDGVDLRLRLASIYWHEVKSVDQARRVFHEVIEIDPANVEALEALETIYEAQGDHEKLLDIYKRRFEVSVYTGEKMAYAFKMASELADHLNDLDGAIKAVRLVLEIDPEYGPAYRELDHLYSKAERYQELAEILRKRIEIAETPEERTYLRMRLAEVLEKRLGDLQGAVEAYRECLAEREEEGAIAELERLFKVEEVRTLIAPILRPIYERTGAHQKLVEVLDVLAEAEEDLTEKVRYYETIATIYETALNDLDRGFEYRAKAFGKAPWRQDLMEKVLEAGRNRSALDEAILVLCEHVFSIEDEIRRRETHRTIAEEARLLGERDLAKRHYTEILLMSPEDIGAMDALIEMHDEDRELDALQAMLRRKAEVVLETDEKVKLLLRAGFTLSDQLNRPEEATAIFRSVLDHDPSNLEALDALERLYEALGRYEDLVEVLDRKVQVLPSDEERVKTLFRKGMVLYERLGNRAEAIETMLSVHAMAPENADCLRMLDLLYGLEEDYFSQFDILEKLFSLTEGPERLALHLRMARLLREKLEDPHRAVRTLEEILAEHEGEREAISILEEMVRANEASYEAFELLRRALERTEDFERLYVAFEVMAEREEDVSKRVAYYIEMGRIASERLGQTLRAFECYRAAFLADPLRSEALSEAERLAEAYDLWSEIPDMISKAVLAIEGMPEALALSLKAAAIRRDRLGDLEGAAADFENILKSYPDNREALLALDGIYSDLGRHEDLARILRMRADATLDKEEKVSLLLRLALVYVHNLKRPDLALETYQEVLYLVPGEANAKQGLRAIADAGWLRAEVLEILEPIYREAGEFEALATLYEATAPEVKDKALRKDILMKLAEVCRDKLNRLEDAFKWAGQALVLDPDDEALAVEVAQYAAELQTYPTLVEIYLDAAASCEDDARKIALWHLAAQNARDNVQDLEKAERIYRWILDLEPKDMAALRALDDIYTRGQRYAELLDILEREAEVEEVESEKVVYLLRAASVQRDYLENPDGAIKAYRAALKLDETNMEALSALAELLERKGEYEELFKVLAQLADLASTGSERAKHLRRMAEIAEYHLLDTRKAVELLDEVSRIEPEDVLALRELQRLYRGLGDYGALVDACERELPLVASDVERYTEVLREIGRVSEEQLEDPYQAQHAFRRLLDVAPYDLEALMRLRRLYREASDLESLSGILDRLSEVTTLSQADLLSVHEEHARLLTDELPRPDKAIFQWRKVLELAPGHLEALEALERLYEDTGSFTECVAVVKERAALEEDRKKKAELLLRAAEIEMDRLGDLRAAAKTMEEALDLFKEEPKAQMPLVLEVFERLRDVYLRLEDFQALSELLLRKDSVLEEAQAKVENLQELARLYEERMADTNAAFLVMLKAVMVNPSDDFVLAEAWRLARATQNYQEYVDTIAEVLDQMPKSFRLEHLLRLGETLWRQIGKPSEAITFYEKVISEWPENEEAHRALADLYQEVSRYEDLVRTLEQLAEITPDFLEKTNLLFRAGEVCEQNIGDPDWALAEYTKVLDIDEGHSGAMRAIARICEKKGDYEGLIAMLERLSTVEPSEELALRLRIAEVLEREIKDSRRAIAAYEAVLNLEPTNPVAIEHLKALYGQEDDWKGLAALYSRMFDYATTVQDRIFFGHSLGILYEEAFGDKKTALEHYLRTLDLDPTDEEVFEKCVSLSMDLNDYSGAIDLLESYVGRTEEPSKKKGALKRIARVYEEKLEDINSAISCWQRVLEIDDGDLEAYENLVRLLSVVESWEEVVQTLLKWKEHVEQEEFIRLMLRAATVVYERLENPDRALKLLGDVLRVDPLNEEAAERMRLIYAEFGDWEKVAKVYLDQEPYGRTDEEKARFWAAAGEVYLNRLKDRDKAITFFEKSLRLNPKAPNVSLMLGQAYVATKNWEKALPLLEMLLEQTDVSLDPDRAAEIHYQLGLCAENLYDYDKAMREYQTALKYKPKHILAIMGLGRIFRRKGLWQLAKERYEEVLEALSKGEGLSLSEEDLIDLHFALAEVCLELGDDSAAISHLEKVTEARPGNERALELLIEIATRRGDWASVIRHKQMLAASKSDPFQRYALLLEIGDLYKDKLQNHYGAIASYKEALEISPEPKVALLKLFEIYLEKDLVEDAIFTLERLAKIEESPEKRALHYMRIAALYREKRKDDLKAIEYLNLALDADPDRLEAFRAIDEILTARKDWEAQAENYRRMIERVKGKDLPDLEFRLYSALGEIYRSRLKQLDYAIPAYAVAISLRPDDVKTHAILAQLYELKGDQFDKAIEEHRAIVALGPLAPEAAHSYRAMRRLYLETKEFDKAFITTGVLVASGFANSDERSFFESNLEPTLPWFKGAVDALRWESHLMSKAESAIIGNILQVLYQGLGADLGARDLKEVGLKKKNELDLEQKLVFSNVYRAVTKALPSIPHRVYRDEATIGMKVEFLVPPGLIVGPDMLTGREEREIAFLLGRQVTYLHPKHFLAVVKNLTELKVFLAAALKFARPDIPVAGGVQVVEEFVRLIERRMPQQLKSQLSRLIGDLIAKEPDLDFDRILPEFFQGMERTAVRAGVLVCGNPEIATSILKAEEMTFSGISRKELIEEVLRFGVSEDHFILRKALGIALEASA